MKRDGYTRLMFREYSLTKFTITMELKVFYFTECLTSIMKMPQEKHSAFKMAKDYIDKDPTDRDDAMGLSSEMLLNPLPKTVLSCCAFAFH